MIYLEELSLMDRDYSNSLSGATEALKASTLRLPVVGGARVCASLIPLCLPGSLYTVRAHCLVLHCYRLMSTM